MDADDLDRPIEFIVGWVQPLPYPAPKTLEELDALDAMNSGELRPFAEQKALHWMKRASAKVSPSSKYAASSIAVASMMKPPAGPSQREMRESVQRMQSGMQRLEGAVAGLPTAPNMQSDMRRLQQAATALPPSQEALKVQQAVGALSTSVAQGVVSLRQELDELRKQVGAKPTTQPAPSTPSAPPKAAPKPTAKEPPAKAQPKAPPPKEPEPPPFVPDAEEFQSEFAGKIYPATPAPRNSVADPETESPFGPPPDVDIAAAATTAATAEPPLEEAEEEEFEEEDEPEVNTPSPNSNLAKARAWRKRG